MIKTMFWDLGGVVLTNAWDREQRISVLRDFGITDKKSLDEFGDRHREVAAVFETGKCSLDEYLAMTLFGMQIDVKEFRDRMMEQSHAWSALPVLQEIASSGRYFMSTLNNESRELNEHRIRRFELQNYFSLFCSSCYLNLTKPQKEIYETALQITQTDADECVFIDDRAQNVEAARLVGMKAIHYETPEQLREDLQRIGVVA
ncbi:MAG: HAD-IA family hydrolase [Bacteroidetes bacterium]|nr:HAD-IA family hydrolase [Bacteroidota bacterium]